MHVRAGEVVALLGSNGAGKTTTIMTIAGHVQLAGGEVRFEGLPWKDPPHIRARRGMAIVTQERSVFMGLTVGENLALGLGDAGEVLELFPELKPFLGKRAGLLSGGQQQMLSVGRATHRHGFGGCGSGICIATRDYCALWFSFKDPGRCRRFAPCVLAGGEQLTAVARLNEASTKGFRAKRRIGAMVRRPRATRATGDPDRKCGLLADISVATHDAAIFD